MSEHSPEPTSPAGSSWGQSQGHIPSPNVQATMTQMTSQLQTVIDAAERAAEAIRFDAEEQARHHLAEAQRKADRLTAERVGLISDLTDDLIRHAATVRDHSEQMIRALEDAISSVTTKLEQPALTDSLGYAPRPRSRVRPHSATRPPSHRRPPRPYTRRPRRPRSPPPLRPPPGPRSPRRRCCTPLTAVAGNDRATISAALRDGYGVADPEPLVARVLGEAWSAPARSGAQARPVPTEGARGSVRHSTAVPPLVAAARRAGEAGVERRLVGAAEITAAAHRREQEAGLGCAQRSVRVAGGDHQRLQHDQQVGERRAVLEVEQVVAELPGGAEFGAGVAAANLGPAGDAGLDQQPPRVVREDPLELGGDLRLLGTGADQGQRRRAGR